LRITAAAALLLLALVTACGGRSVSPESVVRAWSEAVNAGDNERAADLFAAGARVVQGGRLFVLRTHSQALRFNASLPCSGKIVSMSTDRETTTATFLLGDRPASLCDAPGAEAVAAFTIRDGKIVLWHQLPSAAPTPPAPV
jgi:hypothetical protein